MNGANDSIAEKKAIIVLGVERSGTSLLTNILALSGMDVSDALKPGGKANPKGYFEDYECMMIHDDLGFWFMRSIFDAAGILPLPEGWLDHPRTLAAQARLTKLVAHNISKAKTVWGIKHPKTARFLPMWQKIFADLAITPQYVLALRHPMRVASAIAWFSKVPQEHALACWTIVNLEAILHTGGHFHVVHYEDWYVDPVDRTEAVLRYLGLKSGLDRDGLKKMLAETISSELFHNREAGEIPLPVPAALYDTLVRFSHGEVDSGQLYLKAKILHEEWCKTLPLAWSLEIEVKRFRRYMEDHWDILKSLKGFEQQDPAVQEEYIKLHNHVESLRLYR